MLHLRNFSAALLCYLSIIISRCVSAPIDRRALDRNTPGRLPAQDSAWTREDVRDLKRSLQSDINEQWDQCMNEWVSPWSVPLKAIMSFERRTARASLDVYCLGLSVASGPMSPST